MATILFPVTVAFIHFSPILPACPVMTLFCVKENVQCERRPALCGPPSRLGNDGIISQRTRDDISRISVKYLGMVTWRTKAGGFREKIVRKSGDDQKGQ